MFVLLFVQQKGKGTTVGQQQEAWVWTLSLSSAAAWLFDNGPPFWDPPFPGLSPHMVVVNRKDLWGGLQRALCLVLYAHA